VVKGEILGKKFCLSERDYEILLRRFDVQNAEEWNEGYVIDEDCPLCVKYFYSEPECKGCTFRKFSKGGKALGCYVVMKEVCGEDFRDCFLCEEEVSWDIADDEDVRRWLGRIREALLTLRK